MLNKNGERKFNCKNFHEPWSADVDVDPDVGVFDPNIENVLDSPVRLLFMKFAVACDDDENNDDVPGVELDVVMAAVVVAYAKGVMTGFGFSVEHEKYRTF